MVLKNYIKTMKTINNYISERLHLTKNLAANAKYQTEYKYKPTSRKELIKNIIDEYKEQKKDVIDNRDLELDLTMIDTSEIDDMSYVFQYYPTKTIDLSTWDVSHVKDMENMFAQCKNLTDVYGLDKWKTDSLTNIYQMFTGAKQLKNIGDISSWNFKKIKYMAMAFYGCENLEDIGDLDNITLCDGADTEFMFGGCKKLYDKLPKWYKQYK